MATTTKKRRLGIVRAPGELTEIAYLYFGEGPFFEAEDFETETTPEERAAIWKTHRAAIIERHSREKPGVGTWGEVLERSAE